ncbi:hypothetical protein RND71_019120 [Anisodus tanguticus]|uniref:Uncharacterized protein n=1 Tax=Anisodus tanguticus TaxID=243964 RepID=A0AAE1RZY5_9SOLA|nr:hypothetical protein RND71_019120 [Anisodus tanguticus]
MDARKVCGRLELNQIEGTIPWRSLTKHVKCKTTYFLRCLLLNRAHCFYDAQKRNKPKTCYIKIETDVQLYITQAYVLFFSQHQIILIHFKHERVTQTLENVVANSGPAN